MMKVIAFDIETMVDEALYQAFSPPIECKTGNLKDPVKIAEKIAEAKAAQREMAALNPQLARVISAHFAEHTIKGNVPTNGRELVTSSIFMLPPSPEHTSSDREASMLQTVWLTLRDADRVVTFNGASFDIPFLMRRSLLLGVRPCASLETHKYRVTDGKSNHVDTRRVLTETQPGSGIADFIPGDLNYWASVLLGDTSPDELSPEEIAECWRAGNTARIAKYGERDARIAFEIYRKLDGFYFN
jgi:DNA polymerase elongation subunit (family B)